MRFGTKFRILREKKGLSRTSCDKFFGLICGTVSDWENGYAEPENDLLPDIARFFSVTIWELTNNLPLAV